MRRRASLFQRAFREFFVNAELLRIAEHLLRIAASSIFPDAKNNVRRGMATRSPFSCVTTTIVLPSSRQLLHDAQHFFDQFRIERRSGFIERR